MSYGIIENKTCKELFGQINKRLLCLECQKKRLKFAQYDKKRQGIYSNLLLGFSSEKVDIPLDLLIVAEAHGGKDEFFRPQKSTEEEINIFANCYINDRLEKFHQSEMRKLFNELDKRNINWVFTDLIKCFVYYKNKNKDSLINKEIAIKECCNYLDKQVEILLPKKIISLGNTVTKEYFGLDLNSLQHGKKIKHKLNDHKFDLIYSVFPTGMTADLWIAKGGWPLILEQL